GCRIDQNKTNSKRYVGLLSKSSYRQNRSFSSAKKCLEECRNKDRRSLTLSQMPYQSIRPPFTLNVREMSENELRSYFQWFLATVPNRVDMLAQFVWRSPKFELWRPDFTRSSLESLEL